MKHIIYLLFFMGSLYSMTIDEALKTAYEKNLEVKIEDQALEKAKQSYLSALSSFLPQINLSSSYTRLTNIPEMTVSTPMGDQTIPMGYKNNYRNAVSISLPIFAGGKRMLAKNLAGIGVKMEKIKKQQKLEEITENVYRAFYGVVVAKKAYDIMRDAKDRAKEHLDITLARFKDGRVTDLDVLRAKQSFSISKVHLLQAGAAVKSAREGLNITIGLQVSDSIPVEGDIQLDTLVLPLNSLLNYALKNRNEIKMAEQALKSSDMQIKLAESNFLPSIAFITNLSYNRPFNMQDQWKYDYNFTLALTMPIFTGFSTYHKAKESKILKEQAQIRLQLLKRVIEMDVRGAYRSFTLSIQELKEKEEAKKQAKRAMEIAKEQFSEGYISSLEYKDIEFAYTNALFSELQALYNCKMAQVRLAISTAKEVR